MNTNLKSFLIALMGAAVFAGCKKDGSETNGLTPGKETTAVNSKFISRVFEYLPAPGQFINESLGSLAGAQRIIGDVSQTGMVSLGGYGGYIVFGFDHSIINKQGYDLAIYGNPLGPVLQWSEPGIVMVSQDVNGNGLPDDAWYELAGSEYNAVGTIKNYQITYTNPNATANVNWTDNQGGSGQVEVNQFHRHNYYPLFAPNQTSTTFTGTKLKSTWGMQGDIYVNRAFSYGYTDSWSTGDNFETNQYNSFDISWAVNSAGQPVTLAKIDFVKVYTGQNEKGNTMLGEISTEVRGAADLN
ncbi:PKD domain-containing protein [Pedobacter sp. UYP1]|uniref:PKD domain-containing protein n=1 Tax=Pedobacter sp. UYP1 TaxID=1756396 RepID=UPI00339A36ED